MAESEHILVVCTRAQRERLERSSASPGRGVTWEPAMIEQVFYEALAGNDKLIPVLIGEGSEQDIPLVLRPYTYYRVPEQYEELYRLLTRQPMAAAPPLGAVRAFPMFSSHQSPEGALAADDWLADIESTLPQAQRYHDEGLAIARQLAIRAPARTDLQRDLYVSYERLGDLLGAMGDGERARRHYAEGLTAARSLAEREPNRSDLQRDLAVLLIKLGDLSLKRGAVQDARQRYEESSAVLRALVEKEPGRTDLQRDLSSSYDRLGDVQRALGNADESRGWYDQSSAIRRGLAQREPERSDLQRDLAISLVRLADMTPGDAELRREALALLRDLEARGALQAQYRSLLERLADAAAEPT
jgi:tetratricopeptide (TPR) repeat protein